MSQLFQKTSYTISFLSFPKDSYSMTIYIYTVRGAERGTGPRNGREPEEEEEVNVKK